MLRALDRHIADNRHFELFWVSDRDACLITVQPWSRAVMPSIMKISVAQIITPAPINMML